ncbi:MAG: Heme A synthase [Calditrichaeota bacterium]|nr:Heme A synthase [Calditrichota bacterium]
MTGLRRFSWASTIATFIVIFTGGLVRVSGAGLGCPDWPKCFGRWLPPTSVDQLPPEIDASLFNFTLAWIEYGNRVLGMVLGLLIVVTAILALVHARRHIKVWLPSLIALVLVAWLGWQGGQVVASGLEPVLVAAHLLLSLVLALVLLYMTLSLEAVLDPARGRGASYPRKLTPWLTGTWVLALVQAAIGTQLRGALKVMREVEPLGGHSEWMAAVGPISNVHQMLGVVVVGLALHSAATFLKRAERPEPLARQAAVALIAVASVQLLLGLAMLLFGTHALLQVFHLWMSALLLGSLLVLLVHLRRARPLAHET